MKCLGIQTNPNTASVTPEGSGIYAIIFKGSSTQTWVVGNTYSEMKWTTSNSDAPFVIFSFDGSSITHLMDYYLSKNYYNLQYSGGKIVWYDQTSSTSGLKSYLFKFV